MSGRGVRLVGVPLDLGAGRRGVDMGPSALRIAGLVAMFEEMGFAVVDGGNVPVPDRETVRVGDPGHRYRASIASVCRATYAAVRSGLEAGETVVVLGGDHSLAMGSAAAAADSARADGGRLGVVWLDAHGDMNTHLTTPTGNVHGMPLACLLGDGPEGLTDIAERSPALDPDQVALVGVRAIDREEAARILSTGVLARTMRDVDEQGVRQVVAEAVEHLRGSGCDRLHVSFDVDFLDPGIAPGVGTRVRGGPNYREAHLVMEMLADTGLVRSVDVVELNPILDRENETAELAVELLSSLFGRSIL